MKHRFLFFLTVLLLLSNSISAQKNVPAQLQGYWQFKVEKAGDWNGLHIGKSYLEIQYDLIPVDSVRQSGNDYTVYLTHEIAGSISLNITLHSEDSALINFERGRMRFECKRYDRNSEIDYLSVSDYMKVIKGEWFTNNNPQEPFALIKGKLLFEGKQWNIKWFGEFMNREYRALIESEGKHLLIYLVRQDNNSWKIIYNQNPVIYIPMPADKENYVFYGNWYEPMQNEWSYGFFEKFAIFDGKFWDYKTRFVKNNKGVFTLQNGNETLELTLKKTNDSTLKIASGKRKAITYKRASRTLPHYPIVDTVRFKNNHFARVDTAYITGYVRNRKNNNPFKIAYKDILIDEEVSFYGDIDSLGRFQMKVPVYNSTLVFLDWRVMHQMVVLEPNERYFIFYDGSTKQTLFMGNNARIINELAAFNFFKVPKISRQDSVKPLDLLITKKEEYKKANEYVNRVLTQMPYPSGKLRYFLENYTKYQTAFMLMQYRFCLDRHNAEKFPDEYLQFVRDTLLKSPPVPVTLINDYPSFIRDYVGYMHDQQGMLSISSDEVMRMMVENNQLRLNEEDRDAIEIISNYYTGLRNKLDSVELRKLESKITPILSQRSSEIYKENTEQINAETNRVFSEMSLNREFEALEAAISDYYTRDYYSAAILCRNLEIGRMPLESELFNRMVAKIKSPVFRDKVIFRQEFYRNLSHKSLEHTESLKNTDHLKKSKDADALWSELISPYKGKIIYVDFWGTWCGPCKSEMEYVSELKKQFVDKDVVFMYFANNSPEESWKNVIKTYSLTGANVVHYRLPKEQQSLLERRLNVKNFPTYMTIDRNGNVVDTKPPRPSQNETTVIYLNSWLTR